MSDALDEFDTRLAALDLTQFEVELLLDESKIPSDIEAAATFRETSPVNCVKAAIKLVELCADDTNKPASVHMGASASEANLPKLSVPTFCGDVMQ